MTPHPIDQIIRSRRRTLGLQITSDAQLLVRAPLRASMESILRLVNDKLTWIRKHQTRLRLGLQGTSSQRSYVTGETFLVLGTPRPLRVISGATQPFSATPDEFILDESARSNACAHLEGWYRSTALSIIPERAAAFSKTVGLPYTSLRISGAQTRWGSCSRQGRLNFSWRLVMAPLWVIDYVIAHELAHLVHHNHSHRFWSKVGELFSRYKEARHWLKQNQALLKLE